MEMEPGVLQKFFDENNEKETLKILSDAGMLIVRKVGDKISVNMGKLTTHWEKILSDEMDTLNIPIDGFEKGFAVNIGNPHIVFYGKSIENINLKELGPKLKNIIFPNKINEFIEVTNSKKIKWRCGKRSRRNTCLW